jgi:hypothetical protein
MPVVIPRVSVMMLCFVLLMVLVLIVWLGTSLRLRPG